MPKAYRLKKGVLMAFLPYRIRVGQTLHGERYAQFVPRILEEFEEVAPPRDDPPPAPEISRLRGVNDNLTMIDEAAGWDDGPDLPVEPLHLTTVATLIDEANFAPKAETKKKKR